MLKRQTKALSACILPDKNNSLIKITDFSFLECLTSIRELKRIKLEDAEIEVWIEPITDQVMTFDSTLQTGSYI